MNEAAASSFPEALRACMEVGCGKEIELHGHAQRWGQVELATELDISDRLVRKWLQGDVAPGDNHFSVLVALMAPKDCNDQRTAYEQLKTSRPPPRVTRSKPRPSATAAPTPPPPIPPGARPYRGLEAFREEDADIFFGRESLAQNVLDKLDHHRLVLLMGASGSGKTSLINAGILAKRRQDPARTIVRCNPADRAIANLAAALAQAVEPDRSPAELLASQHTYRQQLEANPDTIRTIAQLLPGKRLFLVVDQFEESFTLTRQANPGQHDALIAILLAIARSPDEQKLEALLAMRSDFMNELETAGPELIQHLENAMVQMRAMLPAEREAAIIEPARAYGVTLEPGLLTAITDDLADNRDALPLLEVALDELWSRRDDTSRQLTSQAYTAIGGIAGALGQRAESALENLRLDETLVRRLFLQLVRVDPEGAGTRSTRQPRERPKLGEELWQLGERLATHGLRLLVTSRDDTTGTETLDVTHEAIFRQWPRLKAWIEHERDFLVFCQRLDQRLAEFTASGENPDYLLPRTDVQKAEALLSEGKTFSPDQRAYIAQSATFWAEDAADEKARALWGRLELSFNDWALLPEHDRLALAGLWTAEADTVRRFLVLATVDQDSARKFNRRPVLVLRAALGLDPSPAIARAAPALRGASAATIDASGLAWITLVRHLAPVKIINAGRIVDRAIDLAAKTTDPYGLQALAQAIAALAGHLDTPAIRAAATRTVDRAIDLAAKTTHPGTLQALAQAIAALAPHLPRPAAVLAAIELLKHPLGGAEQVTDSLLRAITTALDRPDLLRPFPEQSFWAVMQRLAELKTANPDWHWLDLARTALSPDDLVATFRRFCAEPPDCNAVEQG